MEKTPPHEGKEEGAASTMKRGAGIMGNKNINRNNPRACHRALEGLSSKERKREALSVAVHDRPATFAVCYGT